MGSLDVLFAVLILVTLVEIGVECCDIILVSVGVSDTVVGIRVAVVVTLHSSLKSVSVPGTVQLNLAVEKLTCMNVRINLLQA